MFSSYFLKRPIACFIMEPWEFLYSADFVVFHLSVTLILLEFRVS